MNDTPRTDAKIVQWSAPEQDWLVTAVFARKLERECDRLAKQCVKNVEEIGQLRVELAHAQQCQATANAVIKHWKEDEGADAKRLEFLMDSSFVEITREEIDEAMEAEQL